MITRDKDFDFHVERSRAFETEVKSLIYNEIPDIKPCIADYLAKRINVLRLQYENGLLKKSH